MSTRAFGKVFVASIKSIFSSNDQICRNNSGFYSSSIDHYGKHEWVSFSFSMIYQSFWLIVTTPVTLPIEHAFWSFDSNYDDFYNVYNGIAQNNASFVSPGYTGYGSALSLNGSRSQYVLIPTFLNMTYRSFTWELWAYSATLSIPNDINYLLRLPKRLKPSDFFFS